MVRFVSHMYHGSHRCLFCHVRTGTIILTASYTVVWTIMAGFELVRLFRPDSKVDVSMVGIHLEGVFHGVETFTSLIFEVLMISISGLGVYGIIKYFPHFLTPFICYLVVDIIIYCIEVLGIYVELPEYMHVKHYVQNVFYFPEREIVAEPDSNKALITYICIFLCVLLLKCFFIYSTWNCYKFIKELEQESSLVNTLLNLRSRTQPPAYEDIMKLPLYEEIVKKAPEELPHKESPPSYTMCNLRWPNVNMSKFSTYQNVSTQY
ncbi:lysosomal-associated transmembrane protein 4A-like [Carcharodon carcharias]|uniref:lysosomal-associated transmembrane protein 4A-like n=1 Tax=Carcharodon carcharias TaxID=13397 RepID=UPI001B7F5397|nr:lysosomal-associated transmembrane protein 4A-like [Carcharodon carcharias]